MAAPKQTDPQFKLRLTANLRDRIAAAADANNRSMNAEMVARLEASFDARPDGYLAEINRKLQTTIDLQQEALKNQKRALVEIRSERYFDSLPSGVEREVNYLRQTMDLIVMIVARAAQETRSGDLLRLSAILKSETIDADAISVDEMKRTALALVDMLDQQSNEARNPRPK